MFTPHQLLYPVFLCLFCSTAVRSQNVPFKSARNLLVVTATFEGVTGNFIIDTGTAHLLLNTRYFDGFPSDLSYLGVTGEQVPALTACGSVELGAHRWKRVPAYVIPMTLVENSLGIPIHGMIGARLFRQYTLGIDFLSHELQLTRTAKSESIPDAYAAATRIPFLTKSSTPTLTVETETGLRLRCTIDTGAEINLISNKHRDAFSIQTPTAVSLKLGGVGRRVDTVFKQYVSGLFVGGVGLQSMKTAFVDLSNYSRAMPGSNVDGILGTEFLRQFRVAIDFRNRQLYLEPLGVTTAVETRK